MWFARTPSRTTDDLECAFVENALALVVDKIGETLGQPPNLFLPSNELSYK